jgi:putative oxidoreductase
MKLRRVFAVPAYDTPRDLALLFLRVVVGLAFMHHGWGKIQHPFSWMGPDAFALPIFQGLAALAEFGGGLAFVLGLLVPLAALGIASTMVVALNVLIRTVHAPFVSQTGAIAYEIALVFLAVAALIGLVGPGRFSLDRLLFGRR